MGYDPQVFVSAIIAAGGRGARFGGSFPKQLSLLAGRPILQHSVEAFLNSPEIAEVVVALPDRNGRPLHALSSADQARIGEYFKRYKRHEAGKFSRVPGWGTGRLRSAPWRRA